jgi:hypothetical protein
LCSAPHLFQSLNFNDPAKTVALKQITQYVIKIKYKNRLKMKFFYSSIFAILLAVNVQVSHAEDAVMIIRFNKQSVDYKKQLEQIVSVAMEAKPDVFFDIVTIVPETGSMRKDRENKDKSSLYSNQVVEIMRKAKVIPDNIRLSFQNSKIVKDSEIHIFAR